MGSNGSSEIKSFVPRFIAWGVLIALLTYGKILWPLMFGYMQSENASFLEAAQQFPLHALAFGGLCFAGLVGYFLARKKYSVNEE